MQSGKSYRAIAEFYDAENAGKAMLEQDVPFFLGQLPRRKQNILEIAVGTGRAAIPMAQAGHHVVGIDYEKDMLDLARRKRDAAGLDERALSLKHADALRLKLGRKFDWICIFFNTFLGFTTLDQQDTLLQVVRRHLKPGGRFWLDIFNPDFRLLARERATGLEPTLFYVPRFDRTVLLTTDLRRGRGVQVQRVTFNYQWLGSHGEERHRRTEFDMTYIFPRELQILMERNGLRIEQVWGNYDGSALGANSPRMIARCCRA
jgi:ubiquinone/menaquinone biosynthesis C-methylase UbiE